MNHHARSPALRAGARYRSRLGWVLALVAAYMVVELVAGFLTGSLALLADAGHMATDALGLTMAFTAIVAADRSHQGGRRTFGLYRLEILAALANAILLFGVAGYVLFEAVQRLRQPTEVLSGPMLVVALLGLAVNIACLRLLHRGAAESLNVEGAYVEVLADLLGSIGAVAAAVIMLATGWTHADPLFGAAIGVFILPRAWRLGRAAVRILVQAAPEGLDLEALRRGLGGIEGVTGVHDLHVWTLTSDMDVASVHLVTADRADAHAILDQARDLLQRSYGISHATLQVEPESHSGCEEVTW